MNPEGVLAEGQSNPIDPDSPVLGSGASGATVRRSRTLPSSRPKNSSSPNASQLVLSASTGKENVGVQFADVQAQAKVAGAKEKRSVLVKKSRRGSQGVVEPRS